MKPEQFLRKLDRVAHDIPKSALLGVNHAAEIGAKYVDISIGAATGGTFRLRGVKSKKPIRAVVVPASNVERPVAVLKTNSPGLVGWLERGTRRHPVGTGKRRYTHLHTTRAGKVRAAKTTKSGRRSTTTARKVLVVGGMPRTGPWMAGGSPAKHVFSHAVDAARPKMLDAVHLGVGVALRGLR